MISKNASYLLKPIIFVFIVAWGFLSVQNAQAQSNESWNASRGDSVYRYFPAHSPVKATWMSAALPGLGQYYNGKYWKIPIIYAGFSSLAYFVMQNRYEYNRYKEAYAISAEVANPEDSDNVLVQNYSSSQLLSQREYYQSNLELSYILTSVFYLLQIVDATVDAHLYDYNMDDNLSFRVEPQWIPTEQGPKFVPGFGIQYKITYQ
jgi:hypothetical protein